MFNPGVFNAGGRTPIYEQYTAGTKGYETEYDNLAPNVGIAWQPNIQNGSDARFSETRPRPRFARVSVCRTTATAWEPSGPLQRQPGNVITTNRTATSTQFPLVPAGQTWPGTAAHAGTAWSVARAFPCRRSIRWRSTSTAA
jgi:hypothetical protein